MALIKCPDCETDVSDAAAACPKCARPIAGQPSVRAYRAPAPAKSKNLSGGFVLLVFVCLGLWIYSQAKTSGTEDVQQSNATSPATATDTQQQTKPEADRPAPAPIIVLTPENLFQQYKANEVATDNALARKTVQITAPVKSIDKDFTDSAVLMFATGEEFSDMGARLKDSEKSKAALLSRGQIVTVQCKTMRRIMESPRGSECVLVDNAPVNQPVAPQSNAAQPSSLSTGTDSAALAPLPGAGEVAAHPVDQDLARKYAEAISNAVTSRWLRPDDLPAEACDVDIVQSLGGNVISATAAANCPYDDSGKRSVENAVLRSQPLPYVGYESVFARHLTFTFRPSM